MNMYHRFTGKQLILFFCLLLPGLSRGQLIEVRSVPLVSGDQFLIFPSRNLGMGAVSIARDDPWLDPFINPAKGVQTRGIQVFSSPTFYSISDDIGKGRSLPFSGLFALKNCFAGLSFAVQQIGDRERKDFILQDVILRPAIVQQSSGGSSETTNYATNTYISGFAGSRLPGSGIAIGGEILWSDLDAVDGVDLLYANSQKIEQNGQLLDLRLGLLSDFGEDRRLELLLLHNRFEMTHEVTYFDWSGERIEKNEDRTHTWGMHLGYLQKIGSPNARLGYIITVNRKTHPKIPNYELMNIPRDPGDTWAFNIGLGLSNASDEDEVALDLIFEPIWSNTWAEAKTPVETRSGGIIAAGGKTVVNDFRFSNWQVRFGVGHQGRIFGFQLGLQFHWIRYWLDQENKIEETQRSQWESWMEWTPSFGLSWIFSNFQLRYTSQLLLGSGQPGVALETAGVGSDFSGDKIIAPAGPLTLRDAHVLTHRITVALSLGE